MVNPHDTPNICLFKINFTQFGFAHEENKKQTLFFSLHLHLSRKRLNNLLSQWMWRQICKTSRDICLYESRMQMSLPLLPGNL